MLIADNIIRDKLKNVYFIWGRGKSTIAGELSRKYGYYIYNVDESRNSHIADADLKNQARFLHDFQKRICIKPLLLKTASQEKQRIKNVI